MEDHRLERSTSCQILAWSPWQKESRSTFQKVLQADMAHVWRVLHTTQTQTKERLQTRVPELKVNPARVAHCAREIAITTSAPLVWWRLKDIFVETPSGGQPSGGAPPARQRRMPELAMTMTMTMTMTHSDKVFTYAQPLLTPITLYG